MMSYENALKDYNQAPKKNVFSTVDFVLEELRSAELLDQKEVNYLGTKNYKSSLFPDYIFLLRVICLVHHSSIKL